MEHQRRSATSTQRRCTDPECKRIRQRLQEEIRTLKSVSYDIMKQKGDWQCGGKTHEEHGETYDEFFLRQVEELATHLETAAHLDRAQAKHLLCQLFQTIHERCKERVVDRMRSTLTEVTSVSGTSERSAEEAESLHDASRAYGLLLHSSHLRETQEHSEISRQVHIDLMRVQQSLSAAEEELKKFSAVAAEVSWGLLTTVPPLVVAQPTRVSRRQHKTEEWDHDGGKDEQLTYYRPVLYSSYEGRVNQKGWVTNRAIDCPDILLNVNKGAVPKTDRGIEMKKMSSRRKKSAKDSYAEFVDLEKEAYGMQSMLGDILGQGGGEGGGEMEGGGGVEGEREEESRTVGLDTILRR